MVAVLKLYIIVATLSTPSLDKGSKALYNIL